VVTGYGVSAKNDHFLTLKGCKNPYRSALIGFENKKVRFMKDLILELPEDLGEGPLDQITAGRIQYDRYHDPALLPPANSTDSDIANLSDLDAFFDEENEIDPDLH
jgi:hypothetical protein